MTEKQEYRAVWRDPDGTPCMSTSPSLQAVKRDVDGFRYAKPDLRFEQRTITVGPWEAAQIDSSGAES